MKGDHRMLKEYTFHYDKPQQELECSVEPEPACIHLALIKTFCRGLKVQQGQQCDQEKTFYFSTQPARVNIKSKYLLKF